MIQLKSKKKYGVFTISKRDNFVTKGFNFNKRERGCPIPPAAPNTATFFNETEEEEKVRLNMFLQEKKILGFHLLNFIRFLLDFYDRDSLLNFILHHDGILPIHIKYISTF